MMIKSILFLLSLCSLLEVHSQTAWCVMRNAEDDGHENSEKNIDHLLTNEFNLQSIEWRSEKWIPVVVHVVTDDPEQFTYAEIVHQIDVLNNDFANRGENLAKLPDDFLALTADTEIRFCLATIDPAGNPTNGITYTHTDVLNIALSRDINGRYVVYYNELGGKTGWNAEQYINIWIAEFGNGILGYGSMPGTAPYPEENGIVMDPHFFGAFGNEEAYFDRGHSLTHEMGHFLGLFHIWGDDAGCDGNDLVDDTPNAANFYTGCPKGQQTSCDANNMYQNFMDLTDDRCLAAFTKGQGERMRATLDSFYPQLARPEPCNSSITNFDAWKNEILWSYDQAANEYIIFHPQGYLRDIPIDIFSVDGRLLKSDLIHRGSSYLIDLDAVPGIYFVRLEDEGKQYVRQIAVY